MNPHFHLSLSLKRPHVRLYRHLSAEQRTARVNVESITQLKPQPTQITQLSANNILF